MLKITLLLGGIGICFISAGCASKDWTEEQIAVAKMQTEEKFKTQNESLSSTLDALLSENREYAELLRELATESRKLHENTALLERRIAWLQQTIDSTKVDTLKRIHSYIDKGDADVYHKITTEQREKIDKLRVEMEKVAVAERETIRLREVVEKILAAYDAVK